MDKKFIILPVIAIALIGVAVASLSSENTTEDPGAPASVTALPDTIDVGVMLPATGDLASHGTDNSMAIQLAQVDFNEHLESIGADWRMNLIIEDTQTDPIIALEKIQSLNSKGIKFILGTETSAELYNVKSYADSNGMMMISPSSTSPRLAVDDNIFRLIPDDNQQAQVLAKLFVNDGIKVVIPVYRGDVWGDGLYKATKDQFESMGGTVDSGIRYSPEITVFSSEADLLDQTVKGYLDEGRPKDDIAILMIGFSEVVHFFNFADSYDTLGDVDWYGSDASSADDAITDDRIASEFAQDVSFTATQFAVLKNAKYEHVKEHITEQIGSAPSNYAYSSYDSLWVLGLTMLETQSLDLLAVRDALPRVASEYDGAIGSIILNEYGDLAVADYELWAVSDGSWAAIGFYSVSDDSFVFHDNADDMVS